VSASTLALLERFQGKFSTKKHKEDDGDDEIKIFFCLERSSLLSRSRSLGILDGKLTRRNSPANWLSCECVLEQALLERFQGKFSTKKHKEDDGDDEIKIFFCSRTQFTSKLA
jgi:hypothetical protein